MADGGDASPRDTASSADESRRTTTADDPARNPATSTAGDPRRSSTTPSADDRAPGAGATADEFLEVEDGRVIVVGYDAWTEPVLAELLDRDNRVTVLVTDETVADRLRDRDLEVTCAPEFDEAAFAAAGLAAADAVYVATLDEQHNVLAVLTVTNVDESADVATFAREAGDVSKLRAAGADVVLPLGEVVADLLVEVALTDRSVEDVLGELTRR